MEQTLGKRIAAYRKEIGLTQEGLAEKLGLTAQAVSKWENDLSCPDILVVPKLAQIFGISTDELLGIQKEEAPRKEEPLEGEIVTDDEEKEKSSATWEISVDKGSYGSVGFAVLVLLVGGLLLAGSFLKWEITFWGVLWPSALLVYGVMGLFRRMSFLRLGCAAVGAYELARLLNLIPERFLLGKNMVFPIVLVLLGLSILLNSFKKPRKRSFHIHRDGHVVTGNTKQFTKGEESFEVSECFGESCREVAMDKLSFGDISVIFGELRVDLTKCRTFSRGCKLDASCTFGELVLYIPRSCRVEPDVGKAFANFEIQGEPDPAAQATIELDASVTFGEIVVKYV